MLTPASASVTEFPEHTRPGFALLGTSALLTALVAAAGAIAFADDDVIAAVCAMTGLLLLAMGIVLTGAPFARAGKPSSSRIVALFAAGMGGLVLMLEVGLVVVVAVVAVSYAIVTLSLLRWPPSEWLEKDKRIRTTRLPFGGIVATLGTIFGFLGLVGVIADTTDPGPVRILLVAVLALAALSVWLRLGAVYAGRTPQRRDRRH